MASTTEQVDVAIVGAGLAGLATAVALHRVRPDAKIKVYERRKAPAGYDSTTTDAQAQDDSTSGKKGSKTGSKEDKDSKESAEAEADDEVVEQLLLGGGVRLEMNGLKAIAAISRDLAGKVVSEGLYANKVLLHDTQGGAVMTRLHEPPHPSSPSPRQPALMIGWSELEALLLNRLPPGTVEWESVAASYTNSPTGVTLNLLKPSHDQEAVPSHALSTAMTHALDTELHQHMEQQRFELGTPDPAAVPSSPFSAAAGTNPFSGTGPAPAAAPVAAAPVLTAPRLERLTVRAKLLVAADGPMSLIRQQCIGDGEPNFEGMVRWVGRLPGDMLSTIPVEQEAWWMGGGMTFASHPLSNGDVAWEAQVSSACLAKAGLKWDQQTQAIIKDSANSTPAQASTTPGGSGSSNSPAAQCMVAPAAAAAAAAAAAPAGSDDGDSGFGGFSTSNGTGSGESQVKRNSRSATPADAPAGEEQSSPATTTTPAATAVGALAAAAALAQAVAAAPESPASGSGVARQGSDTGLSSLITPTGANAATANGPVSTGNGSGSGVRHVKISPAKPTTMTYDPADGNSSSNGSDQPVRDAKALLLQLFADFPTACLDMIETTDGAAILEGPVLTRAARQMPACMGRGGVVVLGEAAHPVRPSGQEASQAFEDAAEFGAAVMQWGINREALRRFELTRRPRWTHAMQVSQAFGSVTNLGGVALHQGLLDYTAQLYHMRFTPLRTMYTPPKPQKKRRNPLLHWTGVALLTYGTLAAAGVTHRHLAKEGKSPLGQVKDPVAQAVVGAVDAVGQSAVKVVSTAADAVLPVVQSPGQTAAAIKNAASKGVGVAKKGVSATIEGSGQAAAVVGRQVGKVAEKIGGQNGADSGSDGWVHGEVPPRHKQNVFARVRDGTVKRVLGAGVFLSRPFTHVLGHQVRGTVAETLGAF